MPLCTICNLDKPDLFVSSEKCPQCGSTASDRFLWIYLMTEKQVGKQSQRILHFSPHECLENILTKLPNIDYWPKKFSFDEHASPFNNLITSSQLGRLPFSDDYFDAIICDDQFTNIPNVDATVTEFLRITKPGGWGVLPSQWIDSLSLEKGETNVKFQTFKTPWPQEHQRHFGIATASNVGMYAKEGVSQRRMIQNKNLIIRILGNDLQALHSNTQTYDNLLFTLQHEASFPNTDKVYILNRIYHGEKKQKLIELLDQYNADYIDLPFEQDIFDSIPQTSFSLLDIQEISYEQMPQFTEALWEYTLYLVNNNGCRNAAIEFGKEQGYEWVFPLDSNSFLTKNDFEKILSTVKDSTRYIIMPQIRLADGGLINNDLLSNPEIEQALQNINYQEPQVAFHRDAIHRYNEALPYGSAPKAEFINALGVPGRWNTYKIPPVLGINERVFKTDTNWEMLGNVIRLSPNHPNNNMESNWAYRLIGLKMLVDEIISNQK